MSALDQAGAELASANAEHQVARQRVLDRLETILEDNAKLRDLYYGFAVPHDPDLTMAIGAYWAAAQRHQRVSNQVLELIAKSGKPLNEL